MQGAVSLVDSLSQLLKLDGRLLLTDRPLDFIFPPFPAIFDRVFD